MSMNPSEPKKEISESRGYFISINPQTPGHTSETEHRFFVRRDDLAEIPLPNDTSIEKWCHPHGELVFGTPYIKDDVEDTQPGYLINGLVRGTQKDIESKIQIFILKKLKGERQVALQPSTGETIKEIVWDSLVPFRQTFIAIGNKEPLADIAPKAALDTVQFIPSLVIGIGTALQIQKTIALVALREAAFLSERGIMEVLRRSAARIAIDHVAEFRAAAAIVAETVVHDAIGLPIGIWGTLRAGRRLVSGGIRQLGQRLSKTHPQLAQKLSTLSKTTKHSIMKGTWRLSEIATTSTNPYVKAINQKGGTQLLTRVGTNGYMEMNPYTLRHKGSLYVLNKQNELDHTFAAVLDQYRVKDPAILGQLAQQQENAAHLVVIGKMHYAQIDGNYLAVVPNSVAPRNRFWRPYDPMLTTLKADYLLPSITWDETVKIWRQERFPRILGGVRIDVLSDNVHLNAEKLSRALEIDDVETINNIYTAIIEGSSTERSAFYAEQLPILLAAKDSKGMTGFTHAMKNGHTDIVIKYHAILVDPHITPFIQHHLPDLLEIRPDGASQILYEAIRNRHFSTVKAYLNLLADPKILPSIQQKLPMLLAMKNHKGESVLIEAIRHNQPGIIDACYDLLAHQKLLPYITDHLPEILRDTNGHSVIYEAATVNNVHAHQALLNFLTKPHVAPRIRSILPEILAARNNRQVPALALMMRTGNTAGIHAVRDLLINEYIATSIEDDALITLLKGETLGDDILPALGLAMRFNHPHAIDAYRHLLTHPNIIGRIKGRLPELLGIECAGSVPLYHALVENNIAAAQAYHQCLAHPQITFSIRQALPKLIAAKDIDGTPALWFVLINEENRADLIDTHHALLVNPNILPHIQQTLLEDPFSLIAPLSPDGNSAIYEVIAAGEWKNIEAHFSLLRDPKIAPFIAPRLPELLIGKGFGAHSGLHLAMKAGNMDIIEACYDLLMDPVFMPFIQDKLPMLLMAEIDGIPGIEEAIKNGHVNIVQRFRTLLLDPRILPSTKSIYPKLLERKWLNDIVASSYDESNKVINVEVHQQAAVDAFKGLMADLRAKLLPTRKEYEARELGLIS